MTEKRGHSVPTAREACKHLRLPVIDDAIESLHMLTVLSTLGPHRLDAGRCIVTSRFRCRSFDRRYVVGALSTGRCLPAVAPRVLVMGDEVRTRSSSPDNHFTPLFKSQPLVLPEIAIGLEPPIEPWWTLKTPGLACQVSRLDWRRHHQQMNHTDGKQARAKAKPLQRIGRHTYSSGLDLETKIFSLPVEAELFS